MQLLDGRTVRDVIRDKLATEVKQFSYTPILEIIDVGGTPETAAYVNQKKVFGESIGVEVVHTIFDITTAQRDIQAHIEKANQDKQVRGIIVQLPLPDTYTEQDILDTVVPEKDVDGLHTENIARLYEGREPLFVPATARGVMELLDAYHIACIGKAVVLGASFLTGKPIAELLKQRGMDVVVCDSTTEHIATIAETADILVSATGVPHLVGRDFVRPEQVIIDVGYALVPGDEGLRVVGDVDFEIVKDVVRALTPVPGGVGPMTVAGLFENVVEAARRT